MNNLLKAVLAANLIVITILVFIYPQLMIAPGKLIPGHKQLDTHCFACHAPFSGVASERCITCHKPSDIGRLLTTGLAIAKPHTSPLFHQQLNSQDCVACHTDHAGVLRFMQQGRFNHALLQKATREQCQNCHKPPIDLQHQQITGSCAQCHTQEKWLPTTFNHSQYFSLDGDHNTRCVTCHVGNDYSHYTCYGCHEHSPSSIRRKHIEEGISNFDNCVHCHRSGNEHDIRNGDGKGNSEKEDD